MLKSTRSKTFIDVVLSIASIVSVIIMIRMILDGYNVFLMLSTLFFCLILLFSKNIKKSIAHFDLITLYIMLGMVIRYVVYPIFFCKSVPDFFSLPYSWGTASIFILECAISLIVLERVLGKYGLPQNMSLNVSSKESGVGLIIILLSLSVIVYLGVPSISENYKFIWNLSIVPSKEKQLTSIVDSISYVLIDVTRLLVPLVIINSSYKKYLRSGSKFYLLLSFAACILPMLLIKNLNRGSSFNTSLIYVWIVTKLYGWKVSRGYVVGILTSIVLLLAVVSAVKHATALEVEGATKSYGYDVVKDYTLGVESLRCGLEANDVYSHQNKMKVLFNDVFSSFPILNRYADFNNRYNELYNNIFYKNSSFNQNDAIAPLMTHMLFIFPLLGFFIPFLFLLWAVKSYKKASKSRSLNLAFVYLYTAIILEAGRTGSLSATIAAFLWVIIPLLIIVKLTIRQRTKHSNSLISANS